MPSLCSWPAVHATLHAHPSLPSHPPSPRVGRHQRFKFKHNLYKLREERDMQPAAFAHMVSATLYEKRFGSYFCQPVIAGLQADGTPYLCGMDGIGAMETAKACGDMACVCMQQGGRWVGGWVGGGGVNVCPLIEMRPHEHVSCRYPSGAHAHTHVNIPSTFLLTTTCLPACLQDFMVAGTGNDSLLGICESLWKPDMEPEELFETLSQSLLSGQDRDCLAGWGAVVFVM
jgi:hypothetical protein